MKARAVAPLFAALTLLAQTPAPRSALVNIAERGLGDQGIAPPVTFSDKIKSP
jgi:hypothetical protein